MVVRSIHTATDAPPTPIGEAPLPAHGIPLITHRLATTLRAIVIGSHSGGLSLACEASCTDDDRTQLATESRTEIADYRVVTNEDFTRLLHATYPRATQTSSEVNSPEQFFNTIIAAAVSQRATDIHFECHGDDGIVRFRINRHLQRQPQYDCAGTLISAIVNVVYREANKQAVSDTDTLSVKHRLPDGRLVHLRHQFYRTGLTPVGNLTIRIVDADRPYIALDNLGMPPALRRHLNDILRRESYGHVMIGANNSGKSTLMRAIAMAYQQAIVNDSNGRDEPKIISIEAPLEVGMPYSQVNVNEADIQSDSYTQQIAKIVRMDYDLCIIGEVNTREAASLFVDVSCAGKFTLSSFHARSTISGLIRLANYTSAHLVIDAIGSLWGMALVPTLCPSCRIMRIATMDDITTISRAYALASRLDTRENSRRYVYDRGRGCDKCFGTGERGVQAIYEMLIMNDHVIGSMMGLVPTQVYSLVPKMIADGVYSPMIAHALDLLENDDISLATFYRVAYTPTMTAG